MTKNGAEAGASSVVAWARRNSQTLVNVYIFLNVAVWVGWHLHKTWAAGHIGFVEVSFAVQNVILVALFLVRRKHSGLDRNILHQAVAVVAFFSGLAFMGQAPTGGETAQAASAWVTLAANVLSALTLVNLGRSFGVLIAIRKVESRGLYSVVRHPMYVSDILLRVGFIITHFGWVTCALFVASSACYVYRALLEEKFLREQPEYREYMSRVKYRFIPYVF